MIQKYKNLGKITTPFGGQTRSEKFHKGIDIANREGTPIPALADGVVDAVGGVKNGMGNIVKMRDNGGNTHFYSHLKGANVRPGQRVKKGQNIAQMGSTGNSYSPSGGDPTHLDIRIANAYGKWKNPLPYIKNF